MADLTKWYLLLWAWVLNSRFLLFLYPSPRMGNATLLRLLRSIAHANTGSKTCFQQRPKQIRTSVAAGSSQRHASTRAAKTLEVFALPIQAPSNYSSYSYEYVNNRFMFPFSSVNSFAIRQNLHCVYRRVERINSCCHQAIPFVVSLSNHERGCDTVAAAKSESVDSQQRVSGLCE
jgi:hypothetical protein